MVDKAASTCMLDSLPFDVLLHIVFLSEPSVVVTQSSTPRHTLSARPCASAGSAQPQREMGECAWRLPAPCAVSRRVRDACAHVPVVIRFNAVDLSPSADPSAAWVRLARRVLASLQRETAVAPTVGGSATHVSPPGPPRLSAVELCGMCDLRSSEAALRCVLLPIAARLAVANGRASRENAVSACALLLNPPAPRPPPAAHGSEPPAAQPACELEAIILSGLRASLAPAGLWSAACASLPPLNLPPARPPPRLRPASRLRMLALPNLHAPELQPCDLLLALHACHGRSLRLLFLGGAVLASSRPGGWDEATAAAAEPAAEATGGADAADGGGGSEGSVLPGCARRAALLPALRALELSYWPMAEKEGAARFVGLGPGSARLIALETARGVAALAELVCEADSEAASGQPSGAARGRSLRACAAAAVCAVGVGRWSPLHEAVCAAAEEPAPLEEPAGSAQSAEDARARGLRAAEEADGAGCTVRRLLSLGASVDARDGKGATAAFHAAYHGLRGLLAQLLAAGADPLLLNHARESLLYIGALRAHLPVVELLACGWAARAPGRSEALLRPGGYHDGWSPLHAACIARSPQIVALLLDVGFGAHALNKHAQTALHVAARVGCAQCVRLLARRGGAELAHARDEHGLTPLAVARRHCPAALEALGERAAPAAQSPTEHGARARGRRGRRAGRHARAKPAAYTAAA